VTTIDLDFELNDVLVALERGLHNKQGKHYHPDTYLVLNVTHFVYRSDIWEMRHSLIENYSHGVDEVSRGLVAIFFNADPGNCGRVDHKGNR